MSRFDHLREQMDACRQGSRDLALPALAELSVAVEQDAAAAAELARSQAFDNAVGAALVDIPVPRGLLERLVAATAKSALEEPAEPVAEFATSVQPIVRRRPRLSRRQMVVGGGAVALGLAIAVALYQSRQPGPVVSEQQLSGAAEEWLAKLQPAAWKSTGGYPAGVPSDIAVRVTPQRWQWLQFESDSGWSANVAALDLSSGGRQQATLFAVRSSARFVVPALPTTTKGLGLSKGLKGIAWQRLDSPWLYVLVVDEVRGPKLEEYLQATHFTGLEASPAGQAL